MRGRIGVPTGLIHEFCEAGWALAEPCRRFSDRLASDAFAFREGHRGKGFWGGEKVLFPIKPEHSKFDHCHLCSLAQSMAQSTLAKERLPEIVALLA